jgi:hypothetical protein
MVADPLSGTSTEYPAELVTAVAVAAARDAHRVCSFLDTLGIRANPETPLPAGFLLHLGAALRMLVWEA